MKRILTVLCTSMTVVMVAVGLLLVFGKPDPDPTRFEMGTTLLTIFGVCLAISLLMYLYERLAERWEKMASMWVDILVRIVIVYAMALLGNWIMGWFQITLDHMLILSLMILPTFIITYFVYYAYNLGYAKEINASIARRRKRQHNQM